MPHKNAIDFFDNEQIG